MNKFESIDHAVDSAVIAATLECDPRGFIQSVITDTDARGHEIPDFTVTIRGNTYKVSVIPCD